MKQLIMVSSGAVESVYAKAQKNILGYDVADVVKVTAPAPGSGREKALIVWPVTGRRATCESAAERRVTAVKHDRHTGYPALQPVT